MIKDFKAFIQEQLNNANLIEEQVIAFLNAKYDGNANAIIHRLKKDSKSDDEFGEHLIKEIYGAELMCLSKSMKDKNNVSDFITELFTNPSLRTDKFHKLAIVLEKFSKSEFVKKMNYSVIAEKLLNEKTIRIKQVREEIGMSQPTFKKWLDFYFPKGQIDEISKKTLSKYHGKHNITFKDYLLIYRFFLGVPRKEHKTEVKEIVDRIASGLTVSKIDIKKETKKRSDAIKEAILYINEIERSLNPIPYRVDKFPYSIALEIIDTIRL
ncbi:hypothetical protein [Flavimarina sp. Hel_I_48]|uniref:hypothetical protein n=1 Tax=Flavimarina sp. Hel_I_48 TaxID=1392488 RepID=UPI0004DF4708|nr:hypothetical protein [Flavimarina sp. Hel_I_48]